MKVLGRASWALAIKWRYLYLRFEGAMMVFGAIVPLFIYFMVYDSGSKRGA
jgi:hypothetical protein